MIKRITIGNKPEIITHNQEMKECKSLINTIADMNLNDLQDWFNQHFSQLNQNEQDGLWMLVKTVWAIAKVLKKIWNIVNWTTK